MNSIQIDYRDESGFSLIELVVVAMILSILGLIVYPTTHQAIIRSQVAKAKADIASIGKAVSMYGIDYNQFPLTQLDIMCCMEIQSVSQLTAPIEYLSHVPFSPWYGKMIFLSEENLTDPNARKYGYRLNYILHTISSPTADGRGYVSYSWRLFTSGPLKSSRLSPKSSSWYNPSNGIMSEGGFWHDSDGRMSL